MPGPFDSDFRMRIVQFAKKLGKRGITATARHFNVDRHTVSRCLRLYERNGRAGLNAVQLSPGVREIRATNMTKVNRARRMTSRWVKGVKLALVAQSNSQIAKEVGAGRAQAAVHTREVGISTKPPTAWDLGQPFTRGRQKRLYEATGLRLQRYAEIFEAELKNIFRVSRDPDCIFPGHDGLRQLVRRNKIIEAVSKRKIVRNGNVRDPGTAAILRSLVPELPSALRLLTKGLRATREILVNEGIEKWEQHIYDQAWREWHRDLRGDLFCKFLPLALELSPFVERELPNLRAGKPNWEASPRILASRFGLSCAVVRDATQGPRLSPEKVATIILEAHSPAPVSSAAQLPTGDVVPAAPTGKRGHKKGYIFPSSNLILQKAKELVVDSGLSFRKAAPIAYEVTRNLNKDERNLLLKRLTALVRTHPDNQPELTAKLLIIRR